MRSFGNTLATAAAGLLMMSSVASATGESVEVFSTSGCGCCIGWIKHMEGAGFEVTNDNLAMADLYARKMKAGLEQDQTSCHTGFVEGYVIEGHVPAASVARLLKERPDAIGLAVPGMPVGSPGMGESGEPYDVLLVQTDGSATVYDTYTQSKDVPVQ